MNKIRCGKCKIEKLENEFYIAKDRSNGHRSYCIECTKEITKKNSQYFTDYHKKRYKVDSEFREKIKKINREYQDNNLFRLNAQCKVHYALKTQKIFKEHCKICGKTKTYAHHEDYSKPLNVIWFCAKCHKQYHIDKCKSKCLLF